jgi:rhodanese-related sulfurtransferase
MPLNSSYPVLLTSTTMALRSVDVDRAQTILSRGGLLIDLRLIDEYLERHVRGSIPLLYEAGPGLGGRARDLLPLDARLILLDDGKSSLEDAAASFRGKGFEVVGLIERGVGGWPYQDLTSTRTQSVDTWEPGHHMLDVADPGTIPPPTATFIPAERLWTKAAELDPTFHFGILAGWGVRAAAAIGILEKLGFRSLAFVRTRPAGATPPMAGPEVFRVGGEP